MTLMYENTPITWDIREFNKLLRWSCDHKMSDLLLNPSQPIYIRVDGCYRPVTSRAIQSSEIAHLVPALTDSTSAESLLRGGKPIDFSYKFQIEDRILKRFRGSASACLGLGTSGLSVTMRSIPGVPPSLDDLEVEEELRRIMFPNRGLVIVTGTMGSGKSTLIAAQLRHIRINRPDLYILTYEEPIEFDLMGIPGAKGPIAQTQIGSHVEKFSLAAPNAARRAADVVLIGESRDKETFKETLVTTDLGVLAYTTAHTRSVPETMRRIMMQFDPSEWSTILNLLSTSLKAIVSQRLEPRVGGGRIAVKEWLEFTPEIRKHLSELRDENSWVAYINEQLHKTGNSMVQYAQRLLNKGLIEDSVFENIKKDSPYGMA